MRHRKSGRKLNRTSSHRKAMFRNMARALLTHERIQTTEPKAKELRSVVESLITLAIRDDLHSRRLAYKALNNHQIVQRLFDEIGPRFKEGGGGYTRILKLSQPRKGDCAAMVVIELTKKASDLEGAVEIQDEKPAKAEAKKAAPKEKAAPKKKAAPKAKKAEKTEDEKVETVEKDEKGEE